MFSFARHLLLGSVIGSSLLFILPNACAFAQNDTNTPAPTQYEYPNRDTQQIDKLLSIDHNTFEEMDRQCQNNNFEACNLLANLHFNHKNYPRAAVYFEKLCYANLPNSDQSCAALNTLYTYDSYNMVDREKGQKVAEYLCNEKKNALGCTVLSQSFFTTKQGDLEKSLHYANKACELQDATGCNQVAVILFMEAYAEKQIAKAQEAFTYYKRACDLGDQHSCEIYAPHQEKLEQFENFAKQHSAAK